MMMTGLDERLDIRYIKLHFLARFTEDTILPKYKASGLRGGMGEMLLRSNCIRDRKCDFCDFESECIVRRTMYSKFDTVKPAFITTGDSSGYVLSCENYETEFEAGDTLPFQLTLFGKTIVYFNLYMQALFALGQQGLGKNRGHFEIVSVTNSEKVPILKDGRNLYMENYRVCTVKDYVEYRMKNSGLVGHTKAVMKFQSPLALKYNGEMLEDFAMIPVIESVMRRIFILDCFENHDLPMLSCPEELIPRITESFVRRVSVPRYSSRQDTKMVFDGINGEAVIEELSDEILPVLFAGEILHIGKNTSFGFGRYRLLP